MNARQKAKRYKKRIENLECLLKNANPIEIPSRKEPLKRMIAKNLIPKYLSGRRDGVIYAEDRITADMIRKMHASSFGRLFEDLADKIMEVEETEVVSEAKIEIWIRDATQDATDWPGFY